MKLLTVFFCLLAMVFANLPDRESLEHKPIASGTVSRAMPNPYASEFDLFIRVNNTKFNFKERKLPVGSVLTRQELKALGQGKILNDNEAIFKHSGFVLADGRTLDQQWDIVKEETLAGTAFETELPNYQTKFLRTSSYPSP